MARAQPAPDPFPTLERPARVEPEKILGSRFVATAAPVADAEAAAGLLAAVRAEFPGADHHGFAWRLAPPLAEVRSGDDGEPSGSTGLPILRQIEGLGLFAVAVVVARWFGGTKLGVGGLMRAYGGAARQALEAGGLAWRRREICARIALPYACQGVLTGWLGECSGRVLSARYGADIELELALPALEHERWLAELRERTGGRLRRLD